MPTALFATELFKNSVEIPSPTTEALCQAAAGMNVNVVMGLCEKRPKTTGTMFNTQLFIGRSGQILGKHQKLMPTVGERLVHTGGFGDSLSVFEMDIGRVRGLICGENSNPLAIFALAAQGTQIHVASWPQHFARGEHRMADVVTFTSRSLSYKGSCFVLNACGTITEKMREVLPYVEEDRAFLENPENGGGSSIVGANSFVVAGPMRGEEEGLLIADIDLEDCVKAKLVHDYSGHYNRPDIFTLTLNRLEVLVIAMKQRIRLRAKRDRRPHPSPIGISTPGKTFYLQIKDLSLPIRRLRDHPIARNRTIHTFLRKWRYLRNVTGNGFLFYFFQE